MHFELLNVSPRSEFQTNCPHHMSVRFAAPIESFLSNINNFWVEASRQGGESALLGQPQRATSNQSGITGVNCERQSSHWSETQASSNCKGSQEMAALGKHPASGSNWTRHQPESTSVLESRPGGCRNSLRNPSRPTTHPCVFAHRDWS
jgi:hypothetical protein